VDNSKREKHGALLDSEILAEVYLELIGGRQPGLVLAAEQGQKRSQGHVETDWRPRPRPTPLASRITPEEEAAHTALVGKLGAAAIWVKRQ
jgi:DNA polymerase-3 subunit epsilon